MASPSSWPACGSSATGNTFGAVAFSSYGAFWISFWALVVFYAPKIPAADAGHAIGLYLWAWAIFTAYMIVASLRTTGAVALVFVLLTVTFILLGAGNSGGHENVIKWGGYVGLATALAAWYASFAVVIELDVRENGPPGDAVEAVTRAASNAASRGRSSSTKDETQPRPRPSPRLSMRRRAHTREKRTGTGRRLVKKGAGDDCRGHPDGNR